MIAALLAVVSAWLALAPPALAAEVTVRASLDRAQVQVGETADLAVEVEGTQDAAAPAISGPEGLRIRYVGPSTQMAIVNGQVSSSITHHFALTPVQTGTFTVGPITVTAGGREYAAGSVQLQALAANAAPSRAGNAAAGGPLRLVLAAPRSTVYLHERVPISLQLWVGNVQVGDVHYPVIPGDGFALEPLSEPAQRREQTAQGSFQVVDFATSLTPLRAGALTVGPARLELAVATRGNDPFFDRFLGGDPFGGGRRTRELASEPLTLNVLPLPDADRPPGFSGAVGRFAFDVDIAPRELQVSDPVTITMRVHGAGSLEHLTPPSVAGGDAWRVYPVQAGSPSPSPTAPRRGGAPPARAQTAEESRTFEQVVIPRRTGTVVLPALAFSYFDPIAGAYRTITHPPTPITVVPAAGAAREEPAPRAAASPAPAPEALGRDLVFIKDVPGTLVAVGARRHRSRWFWAFQLVPLAAWLAVVAYDRRRRRWRADPRLERFTRAGRHARRALASASDAMHAGDRAAFYDGVAGAVRDYLAAKLDLPRGSVSAESVGDRLQARGVSPRVVDDVAAVFTTCERVRFAGFADAAGNTADGDMSQTLARAVAIVRGLERARGIRTLPSSIALLAVVITGALAPSAARGSAWAADNAHTLFFQANGLYGAERYADAAATYEQILAGGQESGNLYFNLGNAYFKAGDAGRAVLAYERARRLIPRDPDLRANLRYAQTETGAADTPPLAVRLLAPLASWLTTDELLLAASAVYTALMLALIAGRLSARAARPSAIAARVLAVVLLVVVASAAYRLVVVELREHAVVTARQNVPVRFEPAAGGTEHFAANPGTVLRVLARREGWAQVARADGERGWVQLDTVTPLE